MKFLLPLVVLGVSSGNELRRGEESRQLGKPRGYNLIHKKSAEEAKPEEPEESGPVTFTNVQHVNVDEEKDDAENDGEDYYYYDYTGDEDAYGYGDEYVDYEYDGDYPDEYGYEDGDEYVDEDVGQLGYDNEYDYSYHASKAEHHSNRPRGNERQNTKPYPRQQDSLYYYGDDDYGDYGYDYDYYYDGNGKESYVSDSNYFDDEKFLSILVGGDHYYTCNKYCIGHNVENFDNGGCSRCRVVEVNGNLDVRCEGKKISRACRQECCEPDGRKKTGFDGREREWDEPNDDMEAVYDYDINYADDTLITRVGDFFFTCDKYCINSECHACDVDDVLNVRCERGIVPQSCRQECCKVGGAERINPINDNTSFLEIIHNYKELAKTRDSLVCLAGRDLIDCSISCIDNNAVRKCQACQVDAEQDVWCEGGEVSAPCIDRCCEYKW
mmetsp:Transcript_14266/g.30071  ORF Transcript_14266/g.30071 Transcript_14266/m.30071 type:complete len:441 (+) Transcript_14266:99-1421(+)